MTLYESLNDEEALKVGLHHNLTNLKAKPMSFLDNVDVIVKLYQDISFSEEGKFSYIIENHRAAPSTYILILLQLHIIHFHPKKMVLFIICFIIYDKQDQHGKEA
jgi:hypothetical protein